MYTEIIEVLRINVNIEFIEIMETKFKLSR